MSLYSGGLIFGMCCELINEASLFVGEYLDNVYLAVRIIHIFVLFFHLLDLLEP